MFLISGSIFVIFFVAGAYVMTEIEEPHVPVAVLEICAVGLESETSWFDSNVKLFGCCLWFAVRVTSVAGRLVEWLVAWLLDWWID
jgi:hypothetical protein